MFVNPCAGFKHTFNPLTKGRLKGRQEVVKVGYYVIEHVATGKIMVGVSKQVSETVDFMTNHLFNQSHPSRAFCKLVDTDCELQITECPQLNIKDAERFLKRLKQSIEPTYLFLWENSK